MLYITNVNAAGIIIGFLDFEHIHLLTCVNRRREVIRLVISGVNSAHLCVQLVLTIVRFKTREHEPCIPYAQHLQPGLPVSM